jgi:hypothetical protein
MTLWTNLIKFREIHGWCRIVEDLKIFKWHLSSIYRDYLHNLNNDHEKRGSSYVVLYLRNLHCGVLLSRLSEAACAVTKPSMHSVDIYITEKQHYVV